VAEVVVDGVSDTCLCRQSRTHVREGIACRRHWPRGSIHGNSRKEEHREKTVQDVMRFTSLQTSDPVSFSSMQMTWRGVIPAMTTKFNDDLSVDHAFLADHARWMVDAG